MIASYLATGIALAAALIAGCERKETIVDVKTPVGDVEVERDKVDNSVDVKVRDK